MSGAPATRTTTGRPHKNRRKAAKCCRPRNLFRGLLGSIVAYVAKEVYNNFELGGGDDSQVSFSNLTELGIRIPDESPLTYASEPLDQASGSYRRLTPVHPYGQSPDTTVVLLNWSRLPNVLSLVSVLCGQWLDDVVAEVFIWNNNPNTTLSYETFQGTGCPSEKLRIHNAPANILFQARYLACAEARTSLCYIQDDDYLVRPEIIRNLHSHFVQSPDIRSLHLSPAKEHLTTQLRTFHTSSNSISTSFAWVGYGTYMAKTTAIEFMRLLGELGASEEEMQMADNYFTIMGNRVPEVWIEPGIEMTGGQPFTIGLEGDVRNLKHISRALKYLDGIGAYRSQSQTQQALSDVAEHPSSPVDTITRAPCRLSTCIIETNIGLLPPNLRHSVDKAADMLILERTNRELLGEQRASWYTTYPLSFAVDGVSKTSFRSPAHAMRGDWIGLNTLASVSRSSTLEMVFLVDEATQQVLSSCQFSYSLDGRQWNVGTHPIQCVKTTIDIDVPECSVRVFDHGSSGTARYFRATVISELKQNVRWVLYDMWLRGVDAPGSSGRAISA